ncbi:MAG TPA: CHASE4 domain-containing protein, partial [Candidatus Synoicihabitans sp.]|nr:CHASE4 domain-containing protein [Candidatus Synoicihabitans sp.]
DQERRLELWLELSSQNLRQFANDYSLWDEMVEYVQAPTAEWARINLDASLPNFDANALWVLTATGELIHHAQTLGVADIPFPLPADDLRVLQQTTRFPWFFHESNAGLLEIRGAPVQPSDDFERTQPAQGWFFVARHWDGDLLESLGRLTETHAELIRADEASVDGPEAGPISFHRSLPDWRGQPLRYLRATRQAAEVAGTLTIDTRQTQIFVLFGVAALLALVVALRWWVLRPLGAIEASLAQRSSAPIVALRHEKTELGRLAQLAAHSFEQQATLEREVGERRQVESALRQSEASLREAIDERARLGRDLHDSVIQAIYASGLGLATLRGLLRTEPDEAERRLEQVRQTLNGTIRDLRNFITGLEPEALQRLGFREAIQRLLDLICAATEMQYELHVDETVEARLCPARQATLLQIVREAVGNVLRHAHAKRLFVQLLGEPSGTVVLEVADDGAGFDPAASTRRGSGLANMAERAKQLGAALEVASAPGKGTRVTIRFPLIPNLK